MFTRLNFEKTKVTEFVPRIFFSQKRERETERERESVSIFSCCSFESFHSN